MSFCKFANEFVADKFITIDNSFITDFMPNAPEGCLKVYLYGLSRCVNGDENSIDDFVRVLNLSEEDVVSSFLYWQDLGLVHVLNTAPIEVRYLPIKNASYLNKKFNKDKYKSFNVTAQEIISGRMITPNEYNEYYNLIESMHIEESALIMIIKYCVKLKGENVNYSYIVAVAKNFAYQGIKTAEFVEERLLEQEKNSSDIKLVLNALKIKRSANEVEYEKFITWTRDYDFAVEVLVHIAKTVTQGGFGMLEYKVNKCYDLKLNSIKEIDEYFENEKELYDIAKSVCKNIGVRYENLSVVVDTYISNWVALGYTKDTLVTLANYCFVRNVRSLDGLNTMISKFYKMGLIDIESINGYIAELNLVDTKIKVVLDKLGIERGVIQQDRNFYNTWINDWNTPEDLLEYAISISADKYQPMQFLNKVLAKYHVSGVTTVDEAKKVEINFGAKLEKTSTTKARAAKGRDYTKAELNSLFTTLKEVDL